MADGKEAKSISQYSATNDSGVGGSEQLSPALGHHLPGTRNLGKNTRVVILRTGGLFVDCFKQV